MTTPAPPASLPAPPALSTSGFQGVLVPPDVQQRILSLVIEQAPFAASLTRLSTSSGTVAFPLASPDGAGWVGELQRIPAMALNDDAYVVAVAKLAGLLDISNETISDSQVNLTAQLGVLLRDSLSRQLDEGLLSGGGPPEPAGVIAAAAAASGFDTLAAVLAARASIADAGGQPDTLAASGAWLADADNQRDASAALLWPRGIADITGLTAVTVPNLDPPLVYDSRRLYLVVRDDAAVEISRDYRFDYDAATMRVKARVAVACPDPARTIRTVAVTGDSGSGGGDADAGATRAARTRKSG